MTARPTCLAQKDTLADAIVLLKKKGFRHVLITDKNKQLAGVVSDRDVLRRLPYANIPAKCLREHYLNVPPNTPGLEIPLAHVMEWEVETVTEDSPVAEAAKKFISGNLFGYHFSERYIYFILAVIIVVYLFKRGLSV